MVNFSKATLLFAIGYVTAIGISVILLPIHSGLRALIVFGIVQWVFPELHFTYLSRTKCDVERCISEIVKVGLYWAGISFVLDIALFSFIVPSMVAGKIGLTFLSTQPLWYWTQFPMMVVTGLIAPITYIKVYKIRADAALKEEILIQ